MHSLPEHPSKLRDYRQLRSRFKFHRSDRLPTGSYFGSYQQHRRLATFLLILIGHQNAMLLRTTTITWILELYFHRGTVEDCPYGLDQPASLSRSGHDLSTARYIPQYSLCVTMARHPPHPELRLTVTKSRFSAGSNHQGPAG